MNYSVVGISGSPVKGGNAETFPGNLLDEASKRGVPAEAFHLSHFEVKDCTHCNICLNKQESGRYWSLKDDAHDIRLGTEHDEAGLQPTAAMMERAQELAGLIRSGS